MQNEFDRLENIGPPNTLWLLEKVGSDDLPYRRRAEMYALDAGGRLYGGLYPNGAFGVFGGGIDSGEDPVEAAVREFKEETGREVTDARLLPIPPHTFDWRPPYLTAKQKRRAKDFRGSKTYYVAGTLGPVIKGKTPDEKNRTSVKAYTLDEVREILESDVSDEDPEALEANKRRLKIIDKLGDDDSEYFSRYKCPECGSTEAFNGIPGTSTSFRGGGYCENGCKFSIVGLELKSIGRGPRKVYSAENLDRRADRDSWMRDNAPPKEKAASAGRRLTSVVPRSALESVRKHGLLGGRAMLNYPDAMAAAAAGRGESVEEFSGDLKRTLRSWKKYQSEGPNAFFHMPPPDAKLSAKNPLRRLDLEQIEIDLDGLMRDTPGTRLYGMEMEPYAEWSKKKGGPERHRYLEDAEVTDLTSRQPSEVWGRYADPEDRGFYAPDVPHVSIHTPDGIVSPKYLKFPGAKIASEARPFTIAVDLDGTLAEQERPFSLSSIGKPRKNALKMMTAFREAGARIIIFTVRNSDGLVRGWLDDHDIPYDFVNENPDQPPESSGKVYADVYFDDRAVDAKDDDAWEEVLARVRAHDKQPEPV